MLETRGGSIPSIGLGTWTLRGNDCVSLVAGAIRAGYRHIDTAANYGNEAEVGQGLRASGIAREALHVTTKVPRPMLAGKDFRRSVENSLKQLGLDHVDLILIHWPSPTVPLAETMEAMNAVREAGLARQIGVSNFTAALVDEAARLSAFPIACNQVEYHPYLDQTRVLAACRRNGMGLVAYCPLARAGELFAEPVVVAAAQAHGRTPAQIVLRWLIQQDGVGAIPRSSDPARIAANLDVSGFALSPAEMAAISALSPRNLRICSDSLAPDWDPPGA